MVDTGGLQPQTTIKAPNRVMWEVITVPEDNKTSPQAAWSQASHVLDALYKLFVFGLAEPKLGLEVQISKAWLHLQLLKIKPREAFNNLVQVSTAATYQKESSSGTMKPKDASCVLQDSAVDCINWHPAAEEVQLLHEEKD